MSSFVREWNFGDMSQSRFGTACQSESAGDEIERAFESGDGKLCLRAHFGIARSRLRQFEGFRADQLLRGGEHRALLVGPGGGLERGLEQTRGIRRRTGGRKLRELDVATQGENPARGVGRCSRERQEIVE